MERAKSVMKARRLANRRLRTLITKSLVTHAMVHSSDATRPTSEFSSAIGPTHTKHAGSNVNYSTDDTLDSVPISESDPHSPAKTGTCPHASPLPYTLSNMQFTPLRLEKSLTADPGLGREELLKPPGARGHVCFAGTAKGGGMLEAELGAEGVGASC